ncbi:MAG: type III-A CRISPR-associated protein Cas10/Csm1 [Bacteroidales bacterium]|nr:type III-A CRISPR-associated protein Cas10/Csm1 [Bacteroidales bacterium]
MAQRDSFYLLTLLHEIGKFIELAQLPEWDQRADAFDAARTNSYRKYSAALTEYIRSQKPAFFEDDPLLTASFFTQREAEESAVLLKLIKIASDCASAEPATSANQNAVKLHAARVHSIFNEITIRNDIGREMVAPEMSFLDVNPLSIEEQAAFPCHSAFVGDEPGENLYHELAKQFLDALIKCKSIDELLNLAQKYLHAVPAETVVDGDGKEQRFSSGVNLYDHMRTTAAIALCFYDELMQGCWQGRENSIVDESANGYKSLEFLKPCVLISGDLSGIQDFIFSIPSKKAAKSLKGRSYFVQLLAEVCVRSLLEELDLKPANLLFNGGGNFFILAPASKPQAFELCSERISKILLEQGCELSVDLACVPVSVQDFGNFVKTWDDVKDAVNRQKRVKYQALDFDAVFSPFSQSNPEEDDLYIDLTTQLVKSAGYRISRFTGKQTSKGWQQIFNELGYEVNFSSKSAITANFGGILFNDCNFEGQASSFAFAVKSLPQWNSQTAIDEFEELMSLKGCRLPEADDQSRNAGSIKTFEALAGHACIETGTAKLGILKMDVDNLGKIFTEGLNTANGRKSPARMMVLSRQLKWFFEGYMNNLIDNYGGTLYPIFSGGDDFFLVGAWQDVFEFAFTIQKKFSSFVCNHPGITLSASLLVVDDHYPVSRFAALAEQRLHKAKHESLEKNCINVFGQNLSWIEFAKAKEIKRKLSDQINDQGDAKAMIQKVLRSCEGLEQIFERAVRFRKAEKNGNSQAQQRFKNEKPAEIKVWRLAYYLREIKEYSKIFVDELVKEYESAFFNALQGEAVNPMYIAVGARWAEMTVRGKKTLSTKTSDNDGRQTV